MCGLVGTIGIRPDASALLQAVDRLRHRGPDDEGWASVGEDVFLGHRRLKVIDLSELGRQPMSNEDGTVWLLYNGEIYNYRELKERLVNKGYLFKSRTDTEVILRLYEESEDDFVHDLNGMFALAIYDKPRKKLLLARDRLGIKPLYYYHANGHFVFASEIKAILALGVYSPDINWQALSDYLTYLYVPYPQTLFRGIFEVPPAHVLEFDLGTETHKLRRYWEISGAAGSGATDGYEEHKEALRSLLKDSVRRQIVSDVPIGVFLSGGVDSPILTGLMAEVSSRPVRTFTVVFQGRDLEFYNEQDAARAIAEKFTTEHCEISVEIAEPMEMLKLVDFFDQPFGNPTFYLMYLISKHTRREVTVALCGAGGDELFAGYPRYRAASLARWLRWVPRSALSGARRLLEMASDDYSTMTLRRARRFLDGLDEDFVRQFVKWTYFLDEKEKRFLLESGTQASGAVTTGFLPSDRIMRHYFEESPLEDFRNRLLHLDVQTFLPGNLLEYTDKMSMAVGLEVRVPYLDHRVVEHSFAIPFEDKLHGRKSKVILKDAFADLLPAANHNAAKKGFNVPLGIWMRNSLDRYFDRHMGQAIVEREGILNWPYIQVLRHQHRTGKRDNSHPLFAIMMFDVWYRKYILQAEVHGSILQ